MSMWPYVRFVWAWVSLPWFLVKDLLRSPEKSRR